MTIQLRVLRTGAPWPKHHCDEGGQRRWFSYFSPDAEPRPADHLLSDLSSEG